MKSIAMCICKLSYGWLKLPRNEWRVGTWWSLFPFPPYLFFALCCRCFVFPFIYCPFPLNSSPCLSSHICSLQSSQRGGLRFDRPRHFRKPCPISCTFVDDVKSRSEVSNMALCALVFSFSFQ